MDHDYIVDQIGEEANEVPEGRQSKLVLQGNKMAQHFVQNVFTYFRERHPQLSALQETAKALQISLNSVRKFKDGPQQNTVTCTRKRKKPVTDDLRESTRADIRDEIYEMYAQKSPVTLKSLLSRLHVKEKCEGSRTGDEKHGLFIQERIDNRRALMERLHVASQRTQFLRRYMENEALGPNKKPCVFIDETWIFSNGAFRRSWQDVDKRSLRKESGEGNRYIVLHAGNENGFIEGASLIFKSKSNIGDYHGEINAANFENWLEHTWLPSLTEPSLILLDNASYHSRHLKQWPTKSWTNFWDANLARTLSHQEEIERR